MVQINAVKRQYCLLPRQCLMRYGALPRMKLERLWPLMARFGEMFHDQRVFREVLGLMRGDGSGIEHTY